jgi:hypothetical protein
MQVCPASRDSWHRHVLTTPSARTSHSGERQGQERDAGHYPCARTAAPFPEAIQRPPTTNACLSSRWGNATRAFFEQYSPGILRSMRDPRPVQHPVL